MVTLIEMGRRALLLSGVGLIAVGVEAIARAEAQIIFFSALATIALGLIGSVILVREIRIHSGGGPPL